MWLQTVAVLCLASTVSLQCISSNDRLTPPASPPDLQVTDHFNLNLFNQLHPSGSRGNFFFSPYSIWSALLMAYFGSEGNTKLQLERTLRLRNKMITLAAYRSLARLISQRRANSNDYVIDLANRVYMQSGLQYNACIGHELPNELRPLDFQKADQAAATINGFVNEVTRGKIPELVQARDIRQAVMVFVNAAYFKGLWLTQFDPRSTRESNFFVAPGQSLRVNMMSTAGSFKIGDATELNAEVLEMPYRGEAASMFVFLPRNTGGPNDLDFMLQKLNPLSLRKGMESVRSVKRAVVKFPKFKLENTIRSELKESLFRMGIQDLFSPAANLTTYSPSGLLYVRDGIHKAVIEVNEEGSEAAAATAFAVVRVATRPREFVCDRPFLFFIHDNVTNNILFLGVFRQPAA